MSAYPPKGTLTIANAASESGVLQLDALAGMRISQIGIVAPATLTNAVKVHVATETGGTFRVLLSGADEVDVPAGKSRVIREMPFGALKLVSAANEGAQRDFSFVVLTRK